MQGRESRLSLLLSGLLVTLGLSGIANCSDDGVNEESAQVDAGVDASLADADPFRDAAHAGDAFVDDAASDGEPDDPLGKLLATPTTAPLGRYWFGPNQLAANVWYRPAPKNSVINGHLSDSFAALTNWPNLATSITMSGGGFAAYAAELGNMAGTDLTRFRSAGLPMLVETPGMTQCLDGYALAALEFDGQSPAGANLFCATFGICAPSATERRDPAGNGWFVSKEGRPYTPDVVIFDERIPNLLPRFAPWDGAGNPLLTDHSRSWADRKAAARFDSCPAADSFNAGVDRMTGLMNDYVEYVRGMRAHFKSAPRYAINWNVNPGWEWADEACLDQLNQTVTDPAAFDQAFRTVSFACHRDTDNLVRLISVLCQDGTCPDAVYMDVDWLWYTPYSLDVLARNKAALAPLGVAFGINIVDGCTDGAHATNQTGDGSALLCVARPGSTPNAMHQESILNIVQYLLAHGIVDHGTRLRFTSWADYPEEVGAAVAETTANSFAHTVNRTFAEVLGPVR